MSAKSVAEKLQVRPGSTVWVSEPARASVVGPLPAGASVADGPGSAQVAVVFADSATAARAALETHAADLAAPAAFWVAYPKGGRADINRDSLWPILAEFGFRPVSQVALDETWSALRFRQPKPGEAPFDPGR